MTARSLQQIAADGRHVAQLRRGAGHQCLAQAADSAAHVRIVRKVAVAHQCADAQATVGQRSMSRSGRRVMSIRRVGCSTYPFIRSRRLVPPARQRVFAPVSAATASSIRLGTHVVECAHRLFHPSRGIAYCRDNADIRTAPAQVAAHALANLASVNSMGESRRTSTVAALMAPLRASPSIATAEQICPGVQ